MFRETLIGLIVLTIVTTNNVVARRLVNKTLYLGVLPMAGFEKFYHNVSLLNLERIHLRTVKNEKGEVKRTTCETIFSHPAMVDLQGADWVDPWNKGIQDDLQKKHSDLYNRYYKAPNVRVLNQVDPQFLNAYRKYNFSVGDVIVPEYAFPCLARNRASNNIEEYLVSVEYLLPRKIIPEPTKKLGKRQRVTLLPAENRAKKREKKVATRFVFRHNADKNETVLIAMIDSATEDVRPTHPNYCEREELDEERRSRELCELPDLQRIRLCSSVLNSKNYTELVRYSAPHVVAPSCRESKLLIRCEEEEINEKEFSDSVMECRANRIETVSKGPAVYYISRGLRPHQFFVSVPMEGNSTAVVTQLFFSYLFETEEPES